MARLNSGWRLTLILVTQYFLSWLWRFEGDFNRVHVVFRFDGVLAIFKFPDFHFISWRVSLKFLWF